MTSIIQDYIYQPIMSAYAAVGLNGPVSRFLATAIVAGGATLILKPEFAFESSGNTKPWVITNPNAKNATLFPWWFVPATAGFVGGFMI